MEIPQGNSWYSHFYLKEAKMSCFSFYIFSSEKLENRKVEQVLPSREGWHQWEGEVIGGEGRRVNKVQKNVYTCMQMQK
jgi:hypothetical protein